MHRLRSVILSSLLTATIAAFHPALALADALKLPLDHPPAATGDALWDRYAQSVWRELTHPAGRLMPRVALLSDAETEQWTDLHSDPRFWQLCLWCDCVSAQWLDETVSKDQWDEVTGELSQGNTWAQVIDGRHEGTLITRLLEMDIRQQLTALERPAIESPALDNARSDWFYRYEQVLQDRVEYKKLEVDFPGNAWPHYLLAFQWKRLGDPKQAFAEFVAGNAANDASMPSLFPCDKAASLLAGDIASAKQLDMGNLLVAAAVVDAGRMERLPGELGELTDFMTAPNSMSAPEYWSAYPFYDLVRGVVLDHDNVDAAILAKFSARTLQSRRGDSRLTVIGLGVAAGLIAQSSDEWSKHGGSLPQTVFKPGGQCDLTNFAAVGRYPERSELFWSHSADSLRWLHGQRLEAGLWPTVRDWDKHAYPDLFDSPESLGQVVKVLNGGLPPAASDVSAADSVALLNALGSTIDLVSFEGSVLPTVITRLGEVDWEKLLPPPAG